MQGALTHSETLMPHIETALRMARVKKDELAGVAVSIGPGSFTGLRIGLAAAKMMSYALRIPMVGVPTLEALAYHCMWEGVRLVPMMDAQKGSVYTEEFAWTWESGKPVLHSVCLFDLSEIQHGISNPEIGEVIFRWCIDMFLPFYIIPNCTVDQECVLKVINIAFDRCLADRLALYALKGCGQLARIGQRTYCRRKDIQQLFQLGFVSDIISADNIGEICLLE